MSTSAFRAHDVVPPRIASPLFASLIREWVNLNALTSSAATASRWGHLEPALAGHARPADLVDAVDAAGHDQQDQMLLALTRLTQAGHQLAGRVLLQLMLPKLARITRNTAGTNSDNAWTEDRHHITVAEFWQVVTTYPTGRRPRKVAANLALETLHRVTADTRGPRPDVPLDPTEFAWLTTTHRTGFSCALTAPTLPAPAATTELTADADLVQVLSWAVGRRVITAGDGNLLGLVYLRQDGWGIDDAAHDLGITPAAVRQRCSRARRRLVAAVRTELTPAPAIAALTA